MIERVLYILCVVGLLTACSSHDEEPAPVSGGRTVALRLLIPADEVTTRTLGDPGSTSVLLAPTKFYIYFVQTNSGDNKDKVVTLYKKDPEHPEETGSSVTGALSLTPPQNLQTYTGYMASSGDKVYKYETLLFGLQEGATTGKFYVVACKEDLGINIRIGTSESDLLNTQFDAAAIRADLPNIYSSPYNYRPDGINYYGTFGGGENVTIDMMLYHVASRVDIKWNVTNDKTANYQSTKKIKTMSVSGLKSENCYIFKPMANIGVGSSPYDSELKAEEEVDRQWYGRASFYTIPFTESNYFDMTMHINDGASDHDTDLKLNMTGAHDVFVPWIRVNLTYDEDTDFTQTELSLTKQ